MNTLIKSIICCIILAGTTIDAMCQTTIVMRKQGNVFVLPCRVNGLLLDMFLDTGADDVVISTTEAVFMFKNGYLTDDDVVGKQSYRTASGSISEGTKVVIKKITFAGLELTNVEATIMPNADAPLLLGQSAIKKLGKIQIDFNDNTLTVFKGKGSYDYSKATNISKGAFDDNKETKSVAVSKKAATGNAINEVMTLKIDRPGGANGANVVWHPVQKKYYAAQAGNAAFPMEVFDASGNMLSSDDLETMFDVRGFWYNPNTKTLQANGYDKFGMSEYALNSKGIPTSNMKLDLTVNKPTEQSGGAYDPKNNVLYFWDPSSVSIDRHNMRNGNTDKTITLYLGTKTRDDINESANENLKYDYNETAIVFTGISGSEIGLLNVREKRIELYSVATGLMTKTLQLPDDAPANTNMNFSFANGIYWLFDKGERVWHGYK